MKKFILSIAFSCVFSFIQAQSFNGVELSGTREEFVAKYLQTHSTAKVVWDRPEYNSTLIEDYFLGYKVRISIDKLKQDNNIHSLWFDIILPNSLVWEEITARYQMVLTYFTEQYGAPYTFMQHRKFDYPFDNGKHYGKELQALEAGKCDYSDIIRINKQLLLNISIKHTYDPLNTNIEYNAIIVSIYPTSNGL